MGFIDIKTKDGMVKLTEFNPLTMGIDSKLRDRQDAYLTVNFVQRKNAFEGLEEYIYQRRRDERKNPLCIDADELINILCDASYNIKKFAIEIGTKAP